MSRSRKPGACSSSTSIVMRQSSFAMAVSLVCADGLARAVRARRGARATRAGETRELDERQLVQLANSAWAAGLSLLMDGDREEAAVWLRRSAERYRESWDAGGRTDAWGRPIGALKALLIAGDDASESARWTLETCLGVRHLDMSLSPIGRYAGVLALLVLGRDEEAARGRGVRWATASRETSPTRSRRSRATTRLGTARRSPPCAARSRSATRSSRTCRFATPLSRSTRSRRGAGSVRASRPRRGRGSRGSFPRWSGPGCRESRATARRRARERPRRPCPRRPRGRAAPAYCRAAAASS